ncbi:MAG: hypothetical protein Q9160_009049 [Pyrenula sp. 1 TL-2023]
MVLASYFSFATSQCNSSVPSLSWYPPGNTSVNDLSSAIGSSGVYGFIYNSSTDPPGVKYGTYNWCNMPHVRPQEYLKVPDEYQLEYVEVIHRHHKRTPYASNTFPKEGYPWNCDDESLYYHASFVPDNQSAQSYWQVSTSPNNPFVPPGFQGSCQFPQITSGGLSDSRQHGADLFAVYSSLLGFLPADYDAASVAFRVTNNQITSQVASQVIPGMYPSLSTSLILLHIQPATIDSLEPTYPCPSATSLLASYATGSPSPAWTRHLNLSAPLFSSLDSISGVSPTNPDWHKSADHYYDNLSARQCHDKPLPCSLNDTKNCVTQPQADAIYRLGLYEYAFTYRAAPLSLSYSVARYGVFIAELAANLRAAATGNSTVRYRHNVAHDGSISPLLSILQLEDMVWPGMGAEVVFELYGRRGDGCKYVRVLWGGRVLRSSHPGLGEMNMLPLGVLMAYFDGLVGREAEKVIAACGG